ncbi:MAG: HIT domain-containing protein [Proteobacteria bacterium]|nr:HIT domain-containing protein [Pseudomonadota bacterium]
MGTILNNQVYDNSCLFCKIVQGNEPKVLVMENENFMVIENKFPISPIHLLVLDKYHREKKDVISGKYSQEGYFEELFSIIYQIVVKYGLDKSGYKIVNNGAGYNHFEHEHFHILGGSEIEPGGST